MPTESCGWPRGRCRAWWPTRLPTAVPTPPSCWRPARCPADC
uniref:Uncharacterized protein n=1 Tax=Mycolicibacterium phage phi1_186018 TaxID=3236641 RepID=A0AB39AKU6_9CAUD